MNALAAIYVPVWAIPTAAWFLLLVWFLAEGRSKRRAEPRFGPKRPYDWRARGDFPE